ncbi:MAG: hypothetical protein Q8O91_11200, partial [Candidatus Aminicenantes bacterium]|nr:hypothetical protein [Candidatus Aminicenantes bacterium]
FLVRSAVFIFDMQPDPIPELRALPKGLLKASIVGLIVFIDEHSFIHGCFCHEKKPVLKHNSVLPAWQVLT